MYRAKLSDGSFIIGLDAEEVEKIKETGALQIDLRLMEGNDLVTIMYADTYSELEAKLIGIFGGPLPMNPWPEAQ